MRAACCWTRIQRRTKLNSNSWTRLRSSRSALTTLPLTIPTCKLYIFCFLEHFWECLRLLFGAQITSLITTAEEMITISPTNSKAWGKLESKNSLSPVITATFVNVLYTFGRKHGDFMFPEFSGISATHCRIYLLDGEVMIDDLSTNGVFVNDIKIGKGRSCNLHNRAKVTLLLNSKFDSEYCLFC